MIWHIMKKDVRLMWIPALAVATIHFATMAVRCWLGLFQEPNQAVVVADLLSVVSLVGIIALTIGVLHQDAVPGVRQDWLIRPIRRGDLIVAKLLFVVLVVQLPILVADTTGALIEGFSFPAAIGAAAARNLAILCYCSLPALMIGAVTRNLSEAIFLVVIGVLGYAVIFFVGAVMLLRIRTSLGGTGLSWIMAATWYALALAGAVGVLCLQFFWRQTSFARALIGVGGAAIILSAFLPWRTAFAIQQYFSPDPAAAAAITLKFYPVMGRSTLPYGAAAAAGASPNLKAVALYLPLQVTGIPTGSIMIMDRATVRITDITGRILYAGRSNLSVDGAGSIMDARLEVQHPEPGDGPDNAYQRVFLPAVVYQRIGSKPVNIDIDYSLSLLADGVTDSMPATQGRGWLNELGTCGSTIDGEGDDVEIRCLHTVPQPSCFTAFLEHSASGLRNPPVHVCEPDYSLFRTSLWPDALFRFGGELPFFDRSGLTRYPVDGPRLAQARLVIRTYLPRAHFTRQLNLPNLRLPELVGPLPR